MNVDYVSVRTQMLMGVEWLAQASKNGKPRELYDVMQDLAQSGALGEDNFSPALRNEREAQALRRLGLALAEVRAEVGKSPADAPEAFLSNPRWKDVTKSARAALAAMTDGSMEWWRFRDPKGL